jgi:hypothetical protein
MHPSLPAQAVLTGRPHSTVVPHGAAPRPKCLHPKGFRVSRVLRATNTVSVRGLLTRTRRNIWRQSWPLGGGPPWRGRGDGAGWAGRGRWWRCAARRCSLSRASPRRRLRRLRTRSRCGRQTRRLRCGATVRPPRFARPGASRDRAVVPPASVRGVCALLPPPVPRFPRCLSRIPRTRLPPAPRAARQRTRRPRRPRADCAPPACHHVRSVHCAVLMDPCSQGGRRHARPLLDEDGPAVLAAARGEQLGGSPGAWRLACPAAACFAVVAGHGQRGHDAQSPGACQPAVGGLDRH